MDAPFDPGDTEIMTFSFVRAWKGSTLTALAAAFLAAISTLTWIADLATRPPCPANYVRLIDVERAAPFASGAILLASVAIAVATRRRVRQRLLTATAIALLALSSMTMVLAVGSVSNHRAPIDNGCWTF
jgi:hypothetical protein